jgi:citrate lyase subunit beta/citryl-CoA lyase
VRINDLSSEGHEDLGVAMRAGAQVIVYPMAQSAAQMVALDQAIGVWEHLLHIQMGTTPILPVCETALGVLEVRSLAAASPRIRMALMGTEDLAHDLCADRSPEGVELAYARQRFLLDCRAAKIEPIDAPYTYGDTDGAIREALQAKRLGYRSKSVVITEHANPVNKVMTPSQSDVEKASALMEAFIAARLRGEDRVWFEGLWVEVPTYKNAQRLTERHEQLKSRLESNP